MTNIRPYHPQDETSVTKLWQSCHLTRPWNPAARDIAEKMKVQPELFLVLEFEERVIGTVMAAYDGHRGVINYLAVAPEHQGQGYARLLMSEAETRLKAMGCPKINLMVRAENHAVRRFYENDGYEEQDVIVLGKWLKEP